MNKSTPAYSQIEGQLRDRIHQGDWPAGTMLPSRRNLAREFGVSSLTIDRAVTRLIAEGLLRADDRRGTFVTRTDAAKSADSPADSSHGPGVGPVTVGMAASLYVSRHDHLELHNFWVRLLLQSLEHAFSEDGRATHFLNRAPAKAGKPLLPLGDALATLAAEGVGAIAVIALGMDPQEVDESLSALEGRNLPVVCVTSGELSRPVPHLFYDNRSAGYQAAEHLLRRGCSRLTFLAPFAASWVGERLDGARAALAHNLVPPDRLGVFPARRPPWVQEEDPEDIGYAAGNGLFAADPDADGILCANDGVALGVLRAASERGLTPGQDFCLVGFDDHPDARAVGLTTLRPPMETLGREAARLLSRALQGERAPLQVRLRSHLIPRRSSQGTGRGGTPL